jgi:hypothetical protein
MPAWACTGIARVNNNKPSSGIMIKRIFVMALLYLMIATAI